MFRPWVCLFVLGVIVATRGLTYEDHADGGYYGWGLKTPDYWPDDYDDWYKDYENIGNNNHDEENVLTNSQEEKIFDDADVANFDDIETIDLGHQVKDEDNMDIRIEKEIQQLRGEVDTEEKHDNEKEPLDYQIEDNRFEPKETQFFETGNDDGLPNQASDENDESLQDFDEGGLDLELDKGNQELHENDQEKVVENHNSLDLTANSVEGIILKGDDNDYEEVLDNNRPLKEDQNMDAVIEETKRILEESDSSFDANNEDLSQSVNDIKDKVDESQLMLPPPEDDKIFEETLSILNEAEIEDFEKDDSQDANEHNIDAKILEETKAILEDLDNNFDDIESKQNDGGKQNINENNSDVADFENMYSSEEVNEDNEDTEFEKNDSVLEKLDNLFNDNKEENLNENIDNGKQTESENKNEQLNSKENIDYFDDIISLGEAKEDDEYTGFENINAILETFSNEFVNNDDQQNRPIDNTDSNKQLEDQNVQLSSDEDTVDKVYEDLNDDLKSLFNTIDKLSNDDDDVNVDEMISNENDYESAEKVNDFNKEQEVEANQSDEKYAELNDDDISQLFEDTFAENEINPNNNLPVVAASKNIVYTDDALIADDAVDNKQDISKESESDTNQGVLNVESPIEYTGNSMLDSKTYDDFMKQFKETHKEELDTQSVDFDKHVAATVITLSVESPVTITSPDYPGPYPANNIIDWIFEGDGVGIEFNITDFAINGFLGDYLLVKPGGVDETGPDGLVFTFNLNQARRYVFSDVNRMFVRFVSNPGMSLLTIRGFEFSVRQLTHKREDSALIPEPTEPVVPEITSNFIVHLAITPDDFGDIADQFQQLIADMATLYINSNGIEPGLNTTSETARILNATICNIKWPNFESCTWVRFGVPLVYEDEEDDDDYRLDEDDLRDMWETYSRIDPFALRMRNLGIEEFTTPNDNAILTAWVIIGVAVVVAVAVLSFVLWRSNCFVQYDRMPSFSDTDSIHSGKKGLDLYPAPHQDLPPLYTEREYNWTNEDTARVDMGGYANKSYVSDLYAIDSDEDEVIHNRNRYTTDV